MLELTDDNFKKEIGESSKPVLVDFWASWCPPCKMIAPVIEKLANDYHERLIVAKVNIDSASGVAQEYGIEQIPTVVLFNHGKPVGSFVGFQPEEVIKKWLDKLLEDGGN